MTYFRENVVTKISCGMRHMQTQIGLHVIESETLLGSAQNPGDHYLSFLAR